MTAVMTQLSETVSDERGTFRARVMARETHDGSWEGWLEFVPPDKDGGVYATPIETRQRDRVTMERWASGLTTVYASGALARARTLHTAHVESDDLLRALQELVQALDRRIPHVERAGEAKISDDARRLRTAASERISQLREHSGDGDVAGTSVSAHARPGEDDRRDRRDRRGDDTVTPRPNDEVPANRREDPRTASRDDDAERKDRRSS